jgi:uncharacterized protein (TIGR03089 family)
MNFPEALARLTASDPGMPLVTFYDHATAERTELSRTTYANWVAKTASYLAQECDLERGHRLALDLPTHWLGPVFLGAAWTVGLSVVSSGKGPGAGPEAGPEIGPVADALVTGPAGLDRWSSQTDSIPVIACALQPLGGRFTGRIPPGVQDFGVDIWSQPDAFVPEDPPGPTDLAADVGTGTSLTQESLLTQARGRAVIADGQRLMSTLNPVRDGLLSFAEVVVRRGSLVLVANPDPERLRAIAETERVDTSDQPIRL